MKSINVCMVKIQKLTVWEFDGLSPVTVYIDGNLEVGEQIHIEGEGGFTLHGNVLSKENVHVLMPSLKNNESATTF